nr:hypothetical protein [Ornithinimicrobium sp. INDO-MA30-4]
MTSESRLLLLDTASLYYRAYFGVKESSPRRMAPQRMPSVG